MAGHSKWANIKHKKEREDAKRGKAFTSLIKEISVAAKTGGGDPTANPRLRTLLEKARDINMPLDNATRAIKRGTGELPGVHYESMTYEGYGPGGIAIIVETLTDNKNRTIAELRHLFSKKGGNIAESGAVSWMFNHKGVVRAETTNSEDELLEMLLDYPVESITETEAGHFLITCDPKATSHVKDHLKSQDITITVADIEWLPHTTSNISAENEKKAFELLEALDDHDDVKSVYTNLE